MKETGAARLSVTGRRMRKAMKVQLGIPGEHNARNALAAAAVGLTFQVTPKQICRALESFAPADKRMQVENLSGVVVYNDTYNANPDSTIAALQTLAAAQVMGKKIAVLADMLELGESASEEHVRVGREVARLGIEYLLTFGQLAKHIHNTAKGSFVVHYDQKNILAEYLAELVTPGDAVLVKGSRGMNMEDVVTFLKERLHQAATPPVRDRTIQRS
jgi:UDP-N-acetylmuramoyl-tripeptide--D-alanyl-D-alanine ligase